MTDREEFISLISGVERNGIPELLQWLETTDFYTCPASARYHGSYSGGLLRHSLNVYHEFKRLLSCYPELSSSPEFSEESIRIITLLHDLCKVNFYTTEKRNRKNEFGQWESYDAYKIDEKFKYGGHGSKSVFIVQSFIKLTPEEATAINCHMGAFCDDWRDIGGAFEQCPLAWLMSVADQSATYIIERN